MCQKSLSNIQNLKIGCIVDNYGTKCTIDEKDFN